MGGRKEREEGLGRALIKQQNRMALEAKEKGRSLHLQNRKVLESYTEIDEIEAIIGKSEEASLLLSGAAAAGAGPSDLLIAVYAHLSPCHSSSMFLFFSVFRLDA
jgi:large subunit GTPase 1